MLIVKICIKCNLSKELSLFGKDSSVSDGYTKYCKSCKKEVRKLTDLKYSKSEKGKIAIKKATRKWNTSCEGRLKRNLARKKLNRKIREKIYGDKKRQEPLEKIKRNIRKRTYTLLTKKGLEKTNSLSLYIGCSYEFLKQHIQAQFQSGMTWQNYGKFGWHLDHIIPLASAKTTKELYKLSHFTNLQPLWAFDNLSKGSR